MIDKILFGKKFLALCERFGKTFSTPTLQQYHECLSEHLTTEEFQTAVAQAFFNNEFFPSPKELIELGKTNATQVYRLPWGEIKAYVEMTPAEQQEYRSQIHRIRQQVSAGLTPIAKPLKVVGVELAQKRRWLLDPVLRKEAIAWAQGQDEVQVVTNEMGEIVDLQEVV